MKILLTGKPGSGKTTVILKFAEITKRAVAGFSTEALKNEEGLRVGFAAVNFNGTRRVLAHKEEFLDSACVVSGKSGGKFFVDVDAVTSFIVPALKNAAAQPDFILIIDEIGKAQIYDPTFLPFVDQIFKSDQDVLGTIVHDPEPWAEKYKNDPGIVLVSVTSANRDLLPHALDVIFSHSRKTKQLNSIMLTRIAGMTQEYLNNAQVLQLEKLYEKALDYVHQPISPNKDENGHISYEIAGNHAKRFVTVDEVSGNYSCTCPLNRGEEKYVGQAGECSHIQAVKLCRAT